MKLFATLLLASLTVGLVFAGDPGAQRASEKQTADAIRFVIGKTDTASVPLCQCEDIGFSCCHHEGTVECKRDANCTAVKKSPIPPEVIKQQKEKEVAQFPPPYCPPHCPKPPAVVKPAPVEMALPCCPWNGYCPPGSIVCPMEPPPPCHWVDMLWVCPNGNVTPALRKKDVILALRAPGDK